MITQKALDKFADAYQTMGIDVEMILAAEVEPSGRQNVMIFYKGNFIYAAPTNVKMTDVINIVRIAQQIEHVVEAEKTRELNELAEE